MQFEPVAGNIGALVKDVDLTQTLSDETAHTLQTGLAEHQVLFFRDQALTPAAHRAVAQVFGETQPHPAYPTIEGYPELSILEVTPVLLIPEAAIFPDKQVDAVIGRRVVDGADHPARLVATHSSSACVSRA